MRNGLIAILLLSSAGAAPPPGATGSERQVTFTPINHWLDNNDNFSKDDRFLCYDTRETYQLGNGSSTSIMKIEIRTGAESTIYAPKPFILDPVNAAPGVIAASYSPIAGEVIFIHGPLLSETPTLGFYAKTNRRGAVAPADGSGKVKFLDARDVTSAITTPGALRGGTHRHEFSLDGKRIGFTYDDAILTNYGRTVGFMMRTPKAPKGALCWAAILVPVVPQGTARPGQLETAAFDSWIGAHGLMRAFIGKVKEPGGAYRNSLFVIDVPATVDITTSDSGARTRYPAPPKGVSLRRLTHTEASGIVRGAEDGTRIAYFANAPDGTRQVFLIDSHGSDADPNPARRPIQATFFPHGVRGAVRWHPSGNSIIVAADNGVAAVCVKPGPHFGKSYFLTKHGPQFPPAEAPVWSHDGARVAFNRRAPTQSANGKFVKDAAGMDFLQIFLTDFPDHNHDGIADPIE